MQETEVPAGASDAPAGGVCYRCCVEEMQRLEAAEPNNNSLSGGGKHSEACLGGDKNVAAFVSEKHAVVPPSGSVEVAEPLETSGLNGGCSKNLTNVYSRNNNSRRYIHNSSNSSNGGLAPPKWGGGGGGVVKTNYLISSISCNDLPDGCHGNQASEDRTGCHGNQVSEERSGCHGNQVEDRTGTNSAGVESTCAIDRKRVNRANKENSVYSEKDALPSNGTPGNQKPTANSSTNKNKKSNKNTLINRYLYLQKKLVLPLFGKKSASNLALKEGRLYKAKSCSEVEKTCCTTGPVKYNVLSKNRCSKHVTEAPLKVTASIVNIDHRTSTVI